MSDELTQLSAAKLALMIRGREVSPVEVVEAHLRRIERVNPKLNALVTLAPDALERARAAEDTLMRGGESGPLHGVPFTVKDTIETKGLKTTSGSLLRAKRVPDEDAQAVARLKAAGAILLGKTNVPEMAIPYECENPLFGRTNNPYELARTSGGSSGGEAAAISACLSPIGLGSDLSGSIRVPAHFCGIVGLKPTTARVYCAGHFPETTGALKLGAVIGPLAREVVDLSMLLDVLTITDEAKSAATGNKTPGSLYMNLRGWRVASYLEEVDAPVIEETERAVQAALRALGESGLLIAEEKPPGMERAISLWPQLFFRPAAEQLSEMYAGNEEQAGETVRAVLASLARSASSSSEELDNAQSERNALRATLMQWMRKTPLIVMPVGSVPAFRHGARRVTVKGREMSIFHAFGYSRAANVLGFPSVSIPAGRTREGLPVGIQIVGRPFADEEVLAAAAIIERSLGGWSPPQTFADTVNSL